MEVTSMTGGGVTRRIENRAITAGSFDFLKTQNAINLDGLAAPAKPLQEKARTLRLRHADLAK